MQAAISVALPVAALMVAVADVERVRVADGCFTVQDVHCRIGIKWWQAQGVRCKVPSNVQPASSNGQT